MTTTKQMNEEEEQSPDLFKLVEEGDLIKLTEVLEEGQQDLSVRNRWDKSILEIAVILGRTEIVKHLITKGGNVNQANKRGYAVLHVGAMWGKRDCLEALIEAGADINAVTKYNETPKDSAARYGHKECVDLFESTEARTILRDAITQARDLLSNPERILGKWNKDDKSKVTGLCNEKTDWLQRSIEAQSSKESILLQVEDFKQRFDPYFGKLDPLTD
ncbi:PREDICTED: ankyrin repeat domain-containing protein 45-like [Amphimedon queenslandica]|uniref:Uncharacterized protein n=1 Tax=Amphimedon queenslandica TaxID=400682 RepID=A0A1X7V2N6_AMPQE|nr:PREDICTED: ankyrin repeat domain-containing protein 45-like [Amphimedon queenslandica]|eukprot:XP_011403387.1 PREDICTED: ankyrin repeat domain-containing protein 45-like [Amphimedon queenslandica]